MKKPSERIKEIAYGLNNNFAERETIFAIMKYLDELHEQQKPKELCIKGGNFACTCEECNKKRMDNLLN